MELIEIYDKNRISTNKIVKRSALLLETEYRLAAAVVLHYNGEFIITQRHPSKKSGLLWEFTGGAVHAGENSLNAAVREAQEEIGIALDKNKLIFLSTILDKQHRLFLDVYTCNINIDIKNTVLQAEEVVNIKKLALFEIEKMCNNNEFAPLDLKIVTLLKTTVL